jgi:hypothetical protein
MVKEMLSPSIYTPGRLALVTGVEPLAIIPYIGDVETKQNIIKIIYFVIGALLIITMLWYFLLKDDSKNNLSNESKDSLIINEEF